MSLNFAELAGSKFIRLKCYPFSALYCFREFLILMFISISEKQKQLWCVFKYISLYLMISLRAKTIRVIQIVRMKNVKNIEKTTWLF